MAKITKRGARKPTVAHTRGNLSGIGWTNYHHKPDQTEPAEMFTVSIADYTVHLTREECERLVTQLTHSLANPDYRKAAGLAYPTKCPHCGNPHYDADRGHCPNSGCQHHIK